jgi:methylglutaconyl-CoA hydratase
MPYKTLLVDESSGVIQVTLNRPDIHNAFNDEMIGEIVDLFASIAGRDHARAVVLRSTGANFCAGADLNWMSKMVSYTRDQNIRDSSLLARMYAMINECPLPVIGRIQGAAIGGGVGLVAVCDIAIATAQSKFG